MIQFRQSIGLRLLLVSIILLALPLLVDSFILVQKRFKHTVEDAKEALIDIARLRELPLAELRPLHRSVLDLLSDNLKLEGNFPSEPSDQLNEKLNKLSEEGKIYGIILIKLTPDGQAIEIASNRPGHIGADFAQLFKIYDLYSPEAIVKGYVSFIYLNAETLNPFFMIARPIYSLKEGRYVGILVLADDISKELEQLLKPDVKTYNINFALLYPSSLIFISSDPSLRFHYFQPLSPANQELFLALDPTVAHLLPKEPIQITDRTGYPFFEFFWKNEQQIGYIVKITEQNYYLLAYASKDAIFKVPLLEFFNVYSIYGIILISGGTIATLLTMRMARPIQNLGAVMQKIQQGEVQFRYHKDPLGFEINSLGDVFNGMVDSLLAHQQSAQEERVKRETLAGELRLGRQVQQSLLPRQMPSYPGVEVAQSYIPAIEVGGDFFDVFTKDNHGQEKLVLAIADVAGKGVQACFYSLSVRNMLRTYAKKYESIAAAMAATNNLFCHHTGETGLFVTVLAATYDYRSRLFSYFSCGHNPGLIRRNNGTIETMVSKGMAMGIFAMQQAQPNQVQLYPGDMVVFYTDGVTESHNEEYHFFGESRLIECLQEEKSISASNMVEGILKRVNAFVGTAPQHDDITLLILKIKDD